MAVPDVILDFGGYVQAAQTCDETRLNRHVAQSRGRIILVATPARFSKRTWADRLFL